MMHPLVQEAACGVTPESLATRLQGQPGLILLRSSFFESPHARYSFVAVRPFLRFRSFGSRCEFSTAGKKHIQYGNPWQLLSGLMARYELLDEIDLPFPLGGCFGFWGYDLKRFVEPKLAHRALNDLELPDCEVGFYDSLVALDHHLGKSWIISTGTRVDGSRDEAHARRRADWWHSNLSQAMSRSTAHAKEGLESAWTRFRNPLGTSVSPNLSRDEFVKRVQRAREYIRAGDIYQVNLAQRLCAPQKGSGWELFQNLTAVSPAPFSAFMDCGAFQLASTSPELFLRANGTQIQTCPIKGTRPRSPDLMRDAQLAFELQTSSKETAELIMITDLLRNDLGKCCEFGTVQTPDLLRLERFPHVQHLVSTVVGRLRSKVSHLDAFASCFPGGSVTGAPKVRAMEIIEELEPVTRGPYTGALGYLGFNRETQLSILIRTALCTGGNVYFSVGAGIVADSDPEAEYQETLVKANGFLEALRRMAGTPQRPRSECEAGQTRLPAP